MKSFFNKLNINKNNNLYFLLKEEFNDNYPKDIIDILEDKYGYKPFITNLILHNYKLGKIIKTISNNFINILFFNEFGVIAEICSYKL